MTAHEQLIRCALAEIRPRDCRSQLNVPAAVGRRNQAEDVDHERLHFASFRVGSVVAAGSDSPVVCHVGLKVAHASRRRSIAVCLEASYYIFHSGIGGNCDFAHFGRTVPPELESLRSQFAIDRICHHRLLRSRDRSAFKHRAVLVAVAVEHGNGIAVVAEVGV